MKTSYGRLRFTIASTLHVRPLVEDGLSPNRLLEFFEEIAMPGSFLAKAASVVG